MAESTGYPAQLIQVAKQQVRFNGEEAAFDLTFLQRFFVHVPEQEGNNLKSTKELRCIPTVRQEAGDGGISTRSGRAPILLGDTFASGKVSISVSLTQ